MTIIAQEIQYDITKYVDVNSSKVNVALPYNEIEFKFAGEGTFLASKHKQLFNKQFGGLNYNGDSSDNWVGKKYTVEAPFERVMFENLSKTASRLVYSTAKVRLHSR